MSLPDKSCRKLDECCQGHTEHGKAQAEVKGLKRQVVLFIVWRVHTSWWEVCIWERKGDCITEVTGPCYPWKWVEAIWAKESRFQGYCKMKWTCHHAYNHKGEASFPLKRKQKQIVTLGTNTSKASQQYEERRRRRVLISFTGKQRRNALQLSLSGPFVLLLNLRYRRITYQPTGPKLKWIPFNKHVFIFLLSCVDSQSGLGKTNITQNPCLILVPC